LGAEWFRNFSTCKETRHEAGFCRIAERNTVYYDTAVFSETVTDVAHLRVKGTRVEVACLLPGFDCVVPKYTREIHQWLAADAS